MGRDEGERAATGSMVAAAWLGVAAAVVLAVFASWPQAGRLAGYAAVSPGQCPPGPTAVDFPARPGRDRALLPLGYRASAPTTAVVCRYRDPQQPVAAIGLDPARSARLAALLGAPAAGWPDDVLSAKHAPPLTDAQLATAAERVAASPCGAAPPSGSATYVISFRYVEGPRSVVVVRGEPCATAANGVITLPAPPGTLEVLDALAALPLA